MNDSVSEKDEQKLMDGRWMQGLKLCSHHLYKLFLHQQLQKCFRGRQIQGFITSSTYFMAYRKSVEHDLQFLPSCNRDSSTELTGTFSSISYRCHKYYKVSAAVHLLQFVHQPLHMFMYLILFIGGEQPTRTR